MARTLAWLPWRVCVIARLAARQTILPHIDE
jgi:hypothetical protein